MSGRGHQLLGNAEFYLLSRRRGTPVSYAAIHMDGRPPSASGFRKIRRYRTRRRAGRMGPRPRSSPYGSRRWKAGALPRHSRSAGRPPRGRLPACGEAARKFGRNRHSDIRIVASCFSLSDRRREVDLIDSSLISGPSRPLICLHLKIHMSENPFRGSDADASAHPLHDPAAVVRHVVDQIRAPLNAIESISCYLEMVLPRTDARARRQLGRLRRELQQVNWILADSLHFLRAVPPSVHPADLSELVAKNLSEWSPPEGPQVRLELDPDLPLIAVDPGQMQHLLRTLVIFFSRHARPGIPLLLRTAAADQRARLEITCAVEDLPPQTFEALFQPFDSELPAGSGLALASVRRIAESHQARLETEFDIAGRVTMAVSFPAASPELEGSLV